ncbi:beta-aspartyl-peptidase [Kistimonas asteriae]|uniref:beta-aspartyl-peptidase n=1 Tax=Kistimonas asteriae TaxID=517724 RepID=UPI001BA55527|nr:beta-aspartyl-peptidase [Kistimonas asteriae]
MFTLLKNANLYAPEPMGKKDVLICQHLIAHIADHIDSTGLPGPCDIMDLEGAILAPGLIDQHIHLIGGGGEGGFHSRTPQVTLSKLAQAGITTVVGVMGTDGTTRSQRDLFAKAKALETEGITAYMHTGSYEVPTRTITGAIRDDLVFLDNVLGVKIALADHRCSFPTTDELARIVADIRIAGMIAGKKGLLHIHMGELAQPFAQINALLDKGLSIKHFSPTHVSRAPHVFDEAICFAKRGGYIDMTPDASYADPVDLLYQALEAGVPASQITFSSDGNGSMPVFNQSGTLTGITAAPVNACIKTLAKLRESGMPFEKAIAFFTKNVAASLGITKGSIQIGSSADLIVFNEKTLPANVISKGQALLKDNELITQGTFE